MANLKNGIDNLIDESNFDGQLFELNIPHNMRYKHYEPNTEHGLYWVTQDEYNDNDIEKFKNAMRKYGIKKAHVVLRDDDRGLRKNIEQNRGHFIDLENEELPQEYKDFNEAKDAANLHKWNFKEDVKRWLKDSPYDLSDEDIENISQRVKIRK